MKSYFEPTGRLIMSIGKDLIKDLPAAIVELVKNAYDADATNVIITYRKNKDSLEIIVKDDGHGMSKDTIIGTWMVPSTDYKLRKKTSPKGRTYQGKKGIGRYAVSLLGNKLKLSTVNDGIRTIAFFNWSDFNTNKKLSDIPVYIETEKTNEGSGTILYITNEIGNDLSEKISDEDTKKIEIELSRLLYDKTDFNIEVCYENFFDDVNKNVCKLIEPVEFYDTCHYRLVGVINKDFSYELKYFNYYLDKEKIIDGQIDIFLKERLKKCGKVKIDYRVYDKDPEGIEIITNFINNTQDARYTKTDIRNILKEQSGISIYRNGFRIRPYGDQGYDWLNLDAQRVQNPSLSIGSEQINGRISIEDEEKSGLKEKSARDGLYENDSYWTLQKIANFALSILEKERFKYRRDNKPKKKDKPLEKLFDFSNVKLNVEKSIEKTRKQLKKSPEKQEEIFKVLNKEVSQEIINLEKEKEEDFLEVKETIAIYQKHTTLGNVISVVLHEGRKPLSWYTNKIPSIEEYLKNSYQSDELGKYSYEKLSKDMQKLSAEAKRLSVFFNRLDPLASNKRGRRKKTNLNNLIKNVLELFQEVSDDEGIKMEFTSSDEFHINIIEEDLYMALTNIIENAIFWVKYTGEATMNIEVSIFDKDDKVFIEISDNGLGVSTDDLVDDIIFTPGYSAKKRVIEDNGTGLGLAIAGEAVQRNNGKLEVIDAGKGACFRITLDRN